MQRPHLDRGAIAARHNAPATVGWGTPRVEHLVIHCAPAGKVRPQALASSNDRTGSEEAIR